MSSISAGSACFLIKDDSLVTWEGAVWAYLREEGFKSWLKKGNYGCNWVYVNVNSKLFAPGIPGIPITQNIGRMYPKNALTIDEFKVIWEIIKKHETTED